MCVRVSKQFLVKILVKMDERRERVEPNECAIIVYGRRAPDYIFIYRNNRSNSHCVPVVCDAGSATNSSVLGWSA